MEITGFRITETTLFSLSSLLVAHAARHTLVIQLIQMQWWRTRGATEFARTGASSAIGMTSLTELGQWIVVLRTQTLHAQTTLQHRMGWTRSAL